MAGPWVVWTAVEDDLIRQRYAAGGSVACQLAMPNRSAGAIHARACRLGIRHDKQPANDDTDTPIPAHEYTPADDALREWRGPVSPGPLRWAA